jgi:hypothetical protein
MSKTFGILLAFALLTGTELQAQDAAKMSSALARKNFPGGIDESDLTVQPVKRITRKGEEIEPEHGYDSGEGDQPSYSDSPDTGD